jgi:hypothetical protein
LFFPERGQSLIAVFQSGLEMIFRFAEQLTRDEAAKPCDRDADAQDEIDAANGNSNVPECILNQYT